MSLQEDKSSGQTLYKNVEHENREKNGAMYNSNQSVSILILSRVCSVTKMGGVLWYISAACYIQRESERIRESGEDRIVCVRYIAIASCVSM